jgi:two-component system, NarL family, response regulator DegU
MSSRIFIISDHLMFGYGLECLLLKEKAVEVIGRGTTIKEAATSIRMLKPDVIIVDNDEISADTIAELLRMMNGNPGVKIIHLSLQSNNLYVYQAVYTKVQRVEDLVEAIKEV